MRKESVENEIQLYNIGEYVCFNQVAIGLEKMASSVP